MGLLIDVCVLVKCTLMISENYACDYDMQLATLTTKMFEVCFSRSVVGGRCDIDLAELPSCGPLLCQCIRT